MNFAKFKKPEVWHKWSQAEKELWINQHGGHKVWFEDYVDEIFNHYRQYGFPFFKLSEEQIKTALCKLNIFDSRSLEKKPGIVGQHMLGLNVCNHFMPHMFEVRVDNARTSMEAFTDDIIFKKIIHYRLRHGTYVNDGGLRKALKIGLGTKSASNFRPTVAKYIYEKFAPPYGFVYDFSCGFGGRYLGCYSSANNYTYMGVEPADKTFQALFDMSKTFAKIHRPGKEMFFKEGSEEFYPSEFKNSVDLAFSSPPYFCKEKYSNENTQSYKKYPEYKDWLDGYLRKTVKNCKKLLKPEGTLVININDIKIGSAKYALSHDTVSICKEEGFELKTTLELLLSQMPGAGLKRREDGYKAEPMYVFKNSTP